VGGKGHVSHVEGRSKSNRNFEEELQGRSLLGRPKRRYEDNIKTELKEIEWKNMPWAYLTYCDDRTEVGSKSVCIGHKGNTGNGILETLGLNICRRW
jgi:hypothetical protein